MSERVQNNFIEFCSIWVVISIICKIFGGEKGLFDIISIGFAFSFILWIPYKISQSAKDEETVYEYDYSDMWVPGFYPALAALVAEVVLVLLVGSVLGELAVGVIMILVVVGSFFVF